MRDSRCFHYRRDILITANSSASNKIWKLKVSHYQSEEFHLIPFLIKEFAGRPTYNENVYWLQNVIYIYIYTCNAVCVTHRSSFYLLLVTYFSTTEVQISWSFSINNARGLDLLTPLTLIYKPSRMIFLSCLLLKILLLHASRWLTATVSDHIVLEWFDRSCVVIILVAFQLWATKSVPTILVAYQ